MLSAEEQDSWQEPFVILHNYRSHPVSPTEPKRPKRLPHPAKPPTVSIIVTRKMAAQLEQQRQTYQPPMEVETEVQEVEEPVEEAEKKFFGEGDLEQAIPLLDAADEDILYNLSGLSRTSNYSKLEKTLLGLNFLDMFSQEEMEQEHDHAILD